MTCFTHLYPLVIKIIRHMATNPRNKMEVFLAGNINKKWWIFQPESWFQGKPINSPFMGPMNIPLKNPLVMTNIAMVIAMAHRNRFTFLKNGGSFHGYVSHNQMVNHIKPYIKQTNDVLCDPHHPLWGSAPALWTDPCPPSGRRIWKGGFCFGGTVVDLRW